MDVVILVPFLFIVILFGARWCKFLCHASFSYKFPCSRFPTDEILQDTIADYKRQHGRQAVDDHIRFDVSGDGVKAAKGSHVSYYTVWIR